MKFDNLGLLITNEPEPGCLGDSCAETSRLGLIHLVLGKDYAPLCAQFITKIGIVRHPFSLWREEDTSNDQMRPLYLYLKASKQTIISRV